MIIEQWIDKYERKTGDKFVHDKRYELVFFSDRGFCEYLITEKMVIARCVCGDILFWRDFLENKARSEGKKACGTWFVRRDIKAYIRLLGYKIMSEQILPNGKSRYICKSRTGGIGWASPYTEISLKEGYYITWEV